MRLAGSLTGFVLVYAGAILGWMGLSVGTCDWGDAQGLFAGAPALLAYAAGTACLIRARPRRLAFLALVPLAPLLVQQVLFAVRLAPGILSEGASACAVLLAAPVEPSGEEGFFLLLWLTLAAVPLVGLSAAFVRATR